MAIFGAVSDDALSFIVDNAENRQFAKGQLLFEEGDLASSMYILTSGRVSVFRAWNGHNYNLRLLQRGDCVGEMSLLACSNRSASVRTDLPTTALEVSNNLLADLYIKFPQQYTIIVMNMAREVCRRLVSADRRLFALNHGGEASIEAAKKPKHVSEVLV